MNTSFTLATQSKKVEGLEKLNNAVVGAFGAFDGMKDYVMECKDINLVSPGKLFLKDILGLTGSEISVTTMGANAVAPFAHKHKSNEEVYIVVKGSGDFELDGKKVAIKEGSIIKVSPACVRKLYAGNDGLIIICIQTEQNSLKGCTLTDGEILG